MAKYLQIPKGFVDPSDSNSHQTNNEEIECVESKHSPFSMFVCESFSKFNDLPAKVIT